MNRQRLTPDFPPYPATCFYPMNKKRKVGENWFMLSKEERSRMMIEHARSGMAFGGRVSQLITVGLGLEDWEWGVTLWAANPEYLKEIVYKMRFDEAIGPLRRVRPVPGGLHRHRCRNPRALPGDDVEFEFSLLSSRTDKQLQQRNLFFCRVTLSSIFG